MRPLRLLLAISSSLLLILVLSFLAATRAHQATNTRSKDGGARSLFDWRTPSSLFPPSAIISLTDDNSTFFLARPANFGPILPPRGLSGQLWIGSGFGDDSFGRGGVAGAEGELGCSDVPGWNDGSYGGSAGRAKDTGDELKTQKAEAGGLDKAQSHKASKGRRSNNEAGSTVQDQPFDSTAEDDGTDDHLHHPLPASSTSTKSGRNKKLEHADIQSIQESAEIAGKVVLLSRGGCGFLEKVKWVQRRGGTALIVGDNIRGGALVTMYGRGDTSNVTIPALFTAHTTAHLLSSLIPSGGLFEDLTLEDTSRGTLGPGDRRTQTGPKSEPGSRAGKNEQKADADDSLDIPSSKYEHSSKSLREDDFSVDEEDEGRPTWLRSLFSTSADPDAHEDSRRPPSSGNIGWVLQEDFVEEEQSIPRTTTSTTKAVVPTIKASSKPAQGDGFVIGVQDWRDPDLVDTNAANVEETSKTPDQPTRGVSQSTGHAMPKGGSITPGSGDYSNGDKKPIGSSKADVSRAGKKLATSQSKKQDQTISDKGRGWLGKFTESSKTDDGSEGDVNSGPPKVAARKMHQSLKQSNKPDDDNDEGQPDAHHGLWVTLQPTSMSSSPFFDTLLVLVVSPLVTLTVVYALLLLRSRIRRRRWRAPKSVVERLPVRTYQTIASATGTSVGSPVSPPQSPPSPDSSTPLLHSGARAIGRRPRSRTTGEAPTAGTSFGQTPSLDQVQEKREAGLAEWRRKYGGKQKECVVCLEEYVDGVSRVMSLPCGHEFHADCITPWLTTRRRTCPICKGDVVRSLARAGVSASSPSVNTNVNAARYDSYDDDDDEDDDDEHHLMDGVQEQALETRNDDPAAAQPVSRADDAFEDLERGLTPDRTR